MINSRRLVDCFKKLVRIDSLSLREKEVAVFLVKELSRLGYKVHPLGIPSGGDTPNLALFLPGNRIKSPVLLLNAHLDTVSPGKGIRPIEKNGYIVPAGNTILGSDNKAGVAVLLELLYLLKKQNLPHPPLQVIFTVAEEIGLYGAQAIPRKALKAKFGLVLDGGDVHQIINQAPSQINLQATIIGRAAHAGIHPEEGINAIKVAAAAIDKMRLGRIDRETTANIGVIEGGKATNIIPDEVKIQGEARSHDLAKLEKQVAHMATTLRASCRQAGAKLKLTLRPVYRAFKVESKVPIIPLYMKAIRRFGYQPALISTGGGSDANVFNQRGIPTINVGVGADRVHTTNERLSVRALTAGAEIVLSFLTDEEAWKNF